MQFFSSHLVVIFKYVIILETGSNCYIKFLLSFVRYVVLALALLYYINECSCEGM